MGSHRFITCVPKLDMAIPEVLWFYFLTEEGMTKIQAASPGGALRNRTLGLDALANIEVPVPAMDGQLSFETLYQFRDSPRVGGWVVSRRG